MTQKCSYVCVSSFFFLVALTTSCDATHTTRYFNKDPKRQQLLIEFSTGFPLTFQFSKLDVLGFWTDGLDVSPILQLPLFQLSVAA